LCASEEEEPGWSLNIAGQTLKNLQTEQVLAHIQGENDRLAARNEAESQPLQLCLRWRNALNLTFVDIPGLQDFAETEAERRLRSNIQQINENMARGAGVNAIFVVVESAKDDKQAHGGRQFLSDTFQGLEVQPEVILLLHKLDAVRSEPGTPEVLFLAWQR